MRAALNTYFKKTAWLTLESENDEELWDAPKNQGIISHLTKMATSPAQPLFFAGQLNTCFILKVGDRSWTSDQWRNHPQTPSFFYSATGVCEASDRCAGLRIRPEVKLTGINALKEIICPWRLNPEEILNREVLAQEERIATTRVQNTN
jgi:hypothetical protein